MGLRVAFRVHYSPTIGYESVMGLRFTYGNANPKPQTLNHIAKKVFPNFLISQLLKTKKPRHSRGNYSWRKGWDSNP